MYKEIEKKKEAVKYLEDGGSLKIILHDKPMMINMVFDDFGEEDGFTSQFLNGVFDTAEEVIEETIHGMANYDISAVQDAVIYAY